MRMSRDSQKAWEVHLYIFITKLEHDVNHQDVCVELNEKSFEIMQHDSVAMPHALLHLSASVLIGFVFKCLITEDDFYKVAVYISIH
jgi:hypothetical protein